MKDANEVTDQTLAGVLAAHEDDLEGYYQALDGIGRGRRVFWDSMLDAWVVTGYRECLSLLTDPGLTRVRLALPRKHGVDDLVDFVEELLNSQTMFSDGPEVMRLRGSWAKIHAKAEKGIEGDSIYDVAVGTLGEIKADEEFDLYSQLLRPYVSRIVCLRLGINEAERQSLYPLITQYARFLDGKVRDEEEFKRSLFAILSLYRWVVSKGCGPATEMYHVRHRWAADYLLNIVAGHESAAYLIATVLLSAGTGSACLSSARDDYHLLSRIINEAIRFDSPVQLIGRKAMTEFSINGRQVRAEDRIFLHIGAANRDAQAFDRPDVFDPDRAGPPHLGFGTGPSRCIGASLALQESVTFLSTLAARRQRLEVNRRGIRWDHGLAGRGFNHLPACLRRNEH